MHNLNLNLLKKLVEFIRHQNNFKKNKNFKFTNKLCKARNEINKNIILKILQIKTEVASSVKKIYIKHYDESGLQISLNTMRRFLKFDLGASFKLIKNKNIELKSNNSIISKVLFFEKFISLLKNNHSLLDLTKVALIIGDLKPKVGL